jgi:hypothetical protein
MYQKPMSTSVECIGLKWKEGFFPLKSWCSHPRMELPTFNLSRNNMRFVWMWIMQCCIYIITRHHNYLKELAFKVYQMSSKHTLQIDHIIFERILKYLRSWLQKLSKEIQASWDTIELLYVCSWFQYVWE